MDNEFNDFEYSEFALQFYKTEITKYKTSSSKRGYLTRERNKNSIKFGELLEEYKANKNSEVGRKLNELLHKNSAIDAVYDYCIY